MDSRGILKAENAGGGDAFGSALVFERDTLAVAAPYEQGSQTGIFHAAVTHNNSALQAGAVYTSTRNGNTWSRNAFIKPPYTSNDLQFGGSYYSQTLSLNQEYLAVGAGFEPGSGRTHCLAPVDSGTCSNLTTSGRPESGACCS